jgi:hypothetical protein
MWLAVRHDRSQFLSDVSRIVHARLLPSQISEDEHPDPRAVGAFGGCHTRPHAGKTPVTDVTAATLHSLIDIYETLGELPPAAGKALSNDEETTDGIKYRFDWEGDIVRGVFPNPGILPFYPTAGTG